MWPPTQVLRFERYHRLLKPFVPHGLKLEWVFHKSGGALAYIYPPRHSGLKGWKSFTVAGCNLCGAICAISALKKISIPLKYCLGKRPKRRSLNKKSVVKTGYCPPFKFQPVKNKKPFALLRRLLDNNKRMFYESNLKTKILFVSRKYCSHKDH